MNILLTGLGKINLTNKSSQLSLLSQEDVHKKIPDRVCNNVPYPAAQKLKTSDLFNKATNVPKSTRLSILKKHLFDEGLLDEKLALKILNDTTDLFRREANVVNVSSPIVICGDIHGQFYDLLKVFEYGGDIEEKSYLFLGDYVDRGDFSCEVIIFLWFMKLLYPKNLTLLRGNHESFHLTEYFSFKGECELKYSNAFYMAAVNSFLALPLAAVVNNKFLCVHGGLSPDLETIDDINQLKRNRETPNNGLLCDILWSDPASDFNNSSKDALFQQNSVRGCSYQYSYNSVVKFLKRNNLVSIIRAHEVQLEGYRFYKPSPNSSLPSLITIFSAPNYIDRTRNKGAIIVYEKNYLNVRQYTEVPHPYILKDFHTGFSWSLPFLVEKVMEIIKAISERRIDTRQVMRVKVIAVTRMLMFLKKIRLERKQQSIYRGYCNTYPPSM